MSSRFSSEAFVTMNMGFFANLPREMRDLIWEDFIAKEKINTRSANLSILLTCKQIYHEVSCPFYQPAGMFFSIQFAAKKFTGTNERRKIQLDTSLSYPVDL